MNINKTLENKFGEQNIEKSLRETHEKIKNGEMEFFTHEEVFENARRIINEQK